MRLQLLGYLFASLALSILSFLLTNTVGRDWTSSTTSKSLRGTPASSGADLSKHLYSFKQVSTANLNFQSARVISRNISNGLPTFVISCGSAVNDAVAEMRPLLTSMLMLVSSPVRIVFLTDLFGAARLRALFIDDLGLYRRSLYVDIIVIANDAIDTFATRMGVDATGDHRTGRWAIAKLMVPWLLPGVTRVIIIDTDMVFVEDPLELWAEHNRGDSEWIYRMPLMKRHSNDNICSCVVLVRCERARNKKVHPDMFIKALSNARTEERKWYNPKTRRWQPEHGDQGLMWILMHTYPKVFSELPQKWNREKCHNYYWVFNEENRGDVGIFHRNCAGNDSRVAVDDASAFFDFFLRFRWHWLIAGKSRGVPVTINLWRNSLPGNNSVKKNKDDSLAK